MHNVIKGHADDDIDDGIELCGCDQVCGLKAPTQLAREHFFSNNRRERRQVFKAHGQIESARKCSLEHSQFVRTFIRMRNPT